MIRTLFCFLDLFLFCCRLLFRLFFPLFFFRFDDLLLFWDDLCSVRKYPALEPLLRWLLAWVRESKAEPILCFSDWTSPNTRHSAYENSWKFNGERYNDIIHTMTRTIRSIGKGLSLLLSLFLFLSRSLLFFLALFQFLAHSLLFLFKYNLWMIQSVISEWFQCLYWLLCSLMKRSTNHSILRCGATKLARVDLGRRKREYAPTVVCPSFFRNSAVWYYSQSLWELILLWHYELHRMDDTGSSMRSMRTCAEAHW